MKFIKTLEGYIRQDKITALRIGYSDSKLCAFAYVNDMNVRLAIFNTREEAQAYLDKLVAELNEEKTCGE